MKSIIKYTYGMLLMGAVASCSPEEFDTINPNDVPSVAGAQINLVVDNDDPTTNTATFSTQSVAGQIPVWVIDGKVYSHLSEATFSDMSAGEHTLELYMSNRNGLSAAAQVVTFEFLKTKIDYTAIYEPLCGKDWHVLYTEEGHLGCGAPGTDGTNWWKAQPNDKADWGVYDDVIRFEHSDSDPVTGGTFTYNPGEGGTVYVNHGVTDPMFIEYTAVGHPDEKDVMVPVEAQKSTFSIVGVNGNNCIQLAPKTLMPYIPHDDMYKNGGLYRIEKISSKRLALIIENADIVWRMVLTSEEIKEKEEEPEEEIEWNYDSSANMWKSATPTLEQIYHADGGWTPYGDGSYTYKLTNDLVSLSLNQATSNQWQAQYKINTGITDLSKDKKYDFHCKFKANKDLAGVTVKLCELGENDVEGSDGIAYDKNTLFAAEKAVDLTAGEEVEFSKVNADGIKLQDNPLMIVFDFGGSPEGFEVEITEIIFQEHGAESAGPVQNVNLWNPDLATLEQIYHADAGWTPYGDGSYEYSLPTSKLVLKLKQATAAQWHAQYKINTGIKTLDPEKKYNFHCKFKSNKDCDGVTIKLCELGENGVQGSDGIAYDANTLFYAEKAVDLTAGEEVEFSKKNQQGIKLQDNPLMIVFDFGGNPENFEVEISEIVIMEAL